MEDLADISRNEGAWEDVHAIDAALAAIDAAEEREQRLRHALARLCDAVSAADNEAIVWPLIIAARALLAGFPSLAGEEMRG